MYCVHISNLCIYFFFFFFCFFFVYFKQGDPAGCVGHLICVYIACLQSNLSFLWTCISVLIALDFILLVFFKKKKIRVSSFSSYFSSDIFLVSTPLS